MPHPGDLSKKSNSSNKIKKWDEKSLAFPFTTKTMHTLINVEKVQKTLRFIHQTLLKGTQLMNFFPF
jgi:hypothetical protein